MQRSMVSALPARQQVQVAAILIEVLTEAWAERRRHPLDSEDRAFVSRVIRDRVVYLRRLG